MGHALLKQTRLPNGLLANCVPESASEVKYLYTEIFERQIYLRHGITISDGNCILDIGANIGMFALYAIQQCKDLRLFCIEPVPVIFNALQANLRQVKPSENNTVHLINKGISNTHTLREIEFYPQIPGNSTLYPKEKRREGKYVSGSLSLTDIWKWNKLGCLLMLVCFPLRRKLFEEHWRRSCRHSQKFTCELMPLSELIEQYNIDAIDLLKIDVEGSEMDVLDGISEPHWEKIQQLVLECSPHNLKSLPGKKEMLRSKGFRQVVIESMDGSPYDPTALLPCLLYATR